MHVFLKKHTGKSNMKCLLCECHGVFNGVLNAKDKDERNKGKKTANDSAIKRVLCLRY